MKNTYYVYQHRSLDTNAIFYVGKGKDKRHSDKNKRSNYWKSYVAKHGFTSEILVNNIDEDFAFLIEMEAIDVYKRREIKLVNLTNGGEGCSGYSMKHSEKQKAKWSISRKGNKNKLGTKLSEESKEKMRLAKLGKPILARRQFTDEQIRQIRKNLCEMDSVAAVARLYNVGESTIRRIRNGITYWDVK
jgi:hypothetical protein